MAVIGENSVRGERGGFIPTEAAAEDPPLWSGALTQGLGEQDPPLPYTTTPRGGPLGKFGSLGIMGADDDRAPPRRDANNLNLRTPHTHLPP